MAQWAFEVTEPAVTQTVPTTTGRPTITFGDWAAGHRDAFLDVSAWTPETGTGG